MSNYSAEKYAESARKHGIPCGPYKTRRIDKARRVESSGDSWERAEIDVSTDDCDVDMAICLASKVEALPDLLIERDELAAAARYVNSKLSALAQDGLTLDADTFCDIQQRLSTALISVFGSLGNCDAALKGGS